MKKNIIGGDWHLLTPKEALSRLETSSQGLEPDAARERLVRYGPNSLGAEVEPSKLKILIDQIKNPLIYILFAAVAVTAALGHFKDSVVIMAVIVINSAIGFWQELRAEQSMHSLRSLVRAKAWVLRGGREMEIESEELVPGDVVLLASGDRVPADLRLLSTTELRIEEAALTGESVPSDKDVATLEDPDLPPADRVNMAYMSTIVVSGRGQGVVTATGLDTLMGQIAEDVRAVGVVKTPLQERFERFAKLLGVTVLCLAVLVVGLGIALGMETFDLFMTAVAMAVAIIPEGLPVVVTITMAIGVSRMARRKSIIRKLHAVETLGSTTVICTDKTGTLTRNEMTVRAFFSMGAFFDVSGSGYDLRGSFSDRETGKRVEIPVRSDLEMALRIGLLCNESSIDWREERQVVKGDPTEVALIVAAFKGGLRGEEEHAAWPTSAIIPFESHRGYMASLHKHDGRNIVFLKGGPEKLLDICAMEKSQVECGYSEVLAASNDLAQDGLRVLAMGWKELPGDLSFDGLTEELTHGVTFVGLAAIIDPPREGVAEAVHGCSRAGIRTVMITGDHAVTAGAIASQIGIGGLEPKALTGREVEAMSDEELREQVLDTSVFARVSPRHKLRIAQAYMAEGEIVAMTGDGVNDAPALKAAHIGVSMGISGTDVAKEASDMVLADDNFASIFHAVEEGRIVFENIRKVALYLLGGGVGILMTILATMLFGMPLPLSATQIIWLNFVTSALQDMSLAFERGEPGTLDQPPRRTDEGILTPALLRRIVLVGLTLSAGTLFLFHYALSTGADLVHARTLALTSVVSFQFFQLFNSRSLWRSVFVMNHLHNPLLFGAVSLAFLAQLSALYVPQVSWLLGTVPLTIQELGMCLGLGVSVLFVVELDKIAIRASRRPGASGSGKEKS